MLRTDTMGSIKALRARGLLTEQQVITAAKFVRNPNAFRLAPTLFRVVHDAIISGKSLEAMERERGWAPRSAKVVISTILYAMEEVGGDQHVGPDEIETIVQERISHLTGETPDDEYLAIKSKYRLTDHEARLLLILQQANGRVLTKENLINRLYWRASEDSVPELKIIDVFICKIRQKLGPVEAQKLVTVWGVGYKWE